MTMTPVMDNVIGTDATRLEVASRQVVVRAQDFGYLPMSPGEVLRSLQRTSRA